jgi:hypothetical protein
MLVLRDGIFGNRRHFRELRHSSAEESRPTSAATGPISAANEFRYQHNGDGSVSFEAPTTGYSVHAPDDGTTPMSASYNFKAFGFRSCQELFFYEPVRVGRLTRVLRAEGGKRAQIFPATGCGRWRPGMRIRG